VPKVIHEFNDRGFGSLDTAIGAGARGRSTPRAARRDRLGRAPAGRGDVRADAGRRLDTPLRADGELVGAEIDQVSRSTSKSAVSREFISHTREHLIDLMSRPLEDLRLAVVMLDGIDLKGRCCVVALGIDTDGVKHPRGLWEGSTENATVATTLLANLVERDQPLGAQAPQDGLGPR
jgi:hypothetical protein